MDFCFSVTQVPFRAFSHCESYPGSTLPILEKETGDCTPCSTPENTHAATDSLLDKSSQLRASLCVSHPCPLKAY